VAPETPEHSAKTGISCIPKASKIKARGPEQCVGKGEVVSSILPGSTMVFRIANKMVSGATGAAQVALPRCQIAVLDPEPSFSMSRSDFARRLMNNRPFDYIAPGSVGPRR
jgi:hypothetical protein